MYYNAKIVYKNTIPVMVITKTLNFARIKFLRRKNDQ